MAGGGGGTLTLKRDAAARAEVILSRGTTPFYRRMWLAVTGHIVRSIIKWALGHSCGPDTNCNCGIGFSSGRIIP